MEVWVMRVVTAVGPGMMTSVGEAVARGDCQVVNGDVVEPVECIEVPPGGDLERAQRRAHELATAAHARTGHVHKVVLSADL